MLTLALAWAGKSEAAFSVDSAELSTNYQEANFESIVASLKPILVPGTACSRQDSILAFKYLSVVYAAYPKTREKGRYCMLRLLDLDPTESLIDLYVGEEVDELFTKARREHVMSPLAQSNAASPPDSIRPMDARKRQWLVTAVTAVAVAGIAWYSWENSPANEKTATQGP